MLCHEGLRGFPTNMNGQNKEKKCNVEDNSAPLKRILCAPVESPLRKKKESGLKLETSVRIYRPSFHENKPKTLVFT
jgi:hypothetical protein